MTPESDANAGISRRQFIVVTAAALVSGYPALAESSSDKANGQSRLINAGLASRYNADGVYYGFLDQGFFIVRKGDKLVAISSNCTHRKCKLATRPDRSFTCPCHGSTFDPTGKVTAGPAKRDLPTLPSFTNDKGELLVRVPNQ